MNDINIKPNETSVYAIGGLNEIGKNTYGIQYKDEIVVIDAGIKFPEDELLGIDYVIPDYQYLIENQHKIKGLFITHGHEDHIGGIPFLLKKINIPIYASPLASALIRGKLEEHHLLKRTVINEISESDEIKFNNLSLSFFRTTHSIPDTLGIAVHTPAGVIVETGDFKFDLTPNNNQPPNLQKMAKLGEEGVLLLMSDSTNAERDEFTKSEAWVGKTIHKVFDEIKGRIIFATFASNMYRIQVASEAALKNGRKIAVFGRSMETAIINGQKLGYLNIPEDMLVDGEEIKHLPPDKVLIMCTGSQGEPMAALSRIANGTHRQISARPDDTIIFSSNPIPGNTASVNQVINDLEETGATIIHGKVNNIHTSGHGGQDEQRLMLSLMKPKFFMPIHGEYRMLEIHTELAASCGVPLDNSFIVSNGDVLALTENSVREAGHIEADDVYIDGNGIGDIGSAVLKERQLLSNDGLVVVAATLNMKTKMIESGPDIVSRGFVYMKESEELIKESRRLMFETIRHAMRTPSSSEYSINKIITRDLKNFLFKKTKRNPIIMPVLVTKQQ